MRNAKGRLVLKIRSADIAGPGYFAEETLSVRMPGSGEVLLETLLDLPGDARLDGVLFARGHTIGILR